MSKWHGGKGSSFRKVNTDAFSANWDRIFKNEENDMSSVISILNNLSEGGTDTSWVVVEQSTEGGLVRQVAVATKEQAEEIRSQWEIENNSVGC